MEDLGLISDAAPGAEKTAQKKRRAVRAVVSKRNQIVLLFVSRDNYHKLPGGGVDINESDSEALVREIHEELGCLVEPTTPFARISEYRDDYSFFQDSILFKAEVIKDEGQPDFTNKELAAGFQILWVNSIDQALRLLAADKPATYEGSFIQRRDIKILKAATKLFK